MDARVMVIAAMAIALGGAPLRSLARPKAEMTRTVTAGTPRERNFAAAIEANLARVPDPPIARAAGDEPFRDRVVQFVRAVAAGRGTCALPEPAQTATVSLYREGALVGRGQSSGDVCVALKDATRRALAAAGAPASIDDARVVVELDGAFIVEHEGRGLELTAGMVPVRAVDRARIDAHIASAGRYLARVLDPARGGAHKFYHPSTDRFEDTLHTVYSASTALTFLKLHARSHDVRDLERARRATDFVRSMQLPSGAFYYSLDTTTGRHDDVLYVGTASKSIFTLLALHERTREPRLLEAATRAADWLITMQQPDGSVRSSVHVDGKKPSHRESLLYTGQVLSAMSRAYRATGKPQYLAAAARTAVYLHQRVATKGCYLGDDYRAPNPISSSWVVTSLLDFDRATKDAQFERVVFECADHLVSRQDKSDDVHRNGRYRGAMSSSGNGWIAEVMSEVFAHCRNKGRPGCARYKTSVVAAARLIMQHTYSPASAFMAKNPDAAIGGVFWSSPDRFVRTDAVCHATNAYLGVIDHLAEGPLVTLPESGGVGYVQSDMPSEGADDE